MFAMQGNDRLSRFFTGENLIFKACAKGLVTNYGEGGGLQNGGGYVKFYLYEKGGTEKVLVVLKGGGGGAEKVLG